ncbi:MAG: hypothetical protein ACE5FD_15870, partial [Anaerolineae bacterium]
MQLDFLVTLTFIIIAAIYMQIMALALLHRDLRIRVERWLVLYLAVMVLWQFIRVAYQLRWFDTAVTTLLPRFIWFGVPLMGLLFYFLSHVFLRQSVVQKRWLALGWLWLLASLGMDFLPLSLPSAWGISPVDLFGGLWIVTWGVVVASTAVLIIRAYRGAKRRPLHRNRIRYWVLALVIASARDLFVFAGYAALSSILHLLVALFIAYAMLTHRFLDVRQVMRRFISYILVVTFIGAVFFTGLPVIRPFLESIPGYSQPFNGFILALILVFLFEPSHRLAQRLVEKLTAGQEYNPERT